MVNISKLESDHAANIQDSGHIYFFNEFWKLVTSIDLTNYDYDIRKFKEQTDDAITICNILMKKSLAHNCAQLIAQINSTRLEIEADEAIIISLIGKSQIRSKRSYFNGIGKLSKFLFGTLDSEDADLYDQQISQLTTKSKETITILGKQTLLFRSAIDSLQSGINSQNGNIVGISQDLDYVKSQLGNLTTEMTNINYEIGIIESFNENLAFLQLFSRRLENHQRKILDILLSASSKKLHPYLLDPKNLNDKLLLISANLPKHLSIPSNLNNPDLHTVYHLSMFDSELINNKIIFEIKIPLIEVEMFNLFSLTPLPVRYNNLDTILKLENNILAVSENNYYYTQLNYETLSKCFSRNRYYFCKKPYNLFSTTMYKTCEFLILKNSKDAWSNCQKRIINFGTELWIQLSENQSWFYYVKSPIDVNIKCKDKLENYVISNRGIINLDKKCSLHSNHLVLQAVSDNSISLKNVNYFKLNIEDTKFQIPSLEHINTVTNGNAKKIIPVKILNTNLGDIGSDLEELRKKEEDLAKFTITEKKNNIFQYSLLVISLAIILVISIYVYLQRNKNRPTNGPHTVQNIKDIPLEELNESDPDIPRYNHPK